MAERRNSAAAQGLAQRIRGLGASVIVDRFRRGGRERWAIYARRKG